MTVWRDAIERLRALRLDSTRSKILGLAVLAALIPTLATTCASYGRSRRSLEGTIVHELRGASTDAARAADLWLQDRLRELRVGAASYVTAENLPRAQGRDAALALGRLRDHLNSVRARFPNHEALLIMDERGRILTSSSGRLGGVRIPPDRFNALRTGDAFVGDAYWDAAFGKAVILLAVPIRRPDGSFLGAFTAKSNLEAIATALRQLSPEEPRDVYLITDEGRLVIRSRTSSADLMRTSIPDTVARGLFAREGQTVEYQGADGEEVLGTLRRAPQGGWAAVAEIPRGEIVRRVGRLRAAAALTIAALLAGVGSLAWVLALLITRPLERLSGAAARVAAGDLAIELPSGGSGDVGHLTRTFSHLVTRLREREGQGELERLSVTDALTGLYNRRHLVGTLANEVQRSRRLRRTFSVLLADVDHFKRYNDTYGHLAGDAALVKIAEVLRKMTRGVDSVARYGGEEFLVMLLEAPLAVAGTVAERIRARVAGEDFDGRKLTMSIGVAEYPMHGDTPEELIASADAGLYRAKDAGRDRVVIAGRQPEPKEPGRKRRRKGEA